MSGGIVYDSNWDGKEVWKLIEPDGRTADFFESSQKRAEDYAIAEALTGSRATREESLQAAYAAGYKIEKVR